jgi:DNA invertase Pin-like site-specific DNA recombinase
MNNSQNELQFLVGQLVVAYIRVSDEDSDAERQRKAITHWAHQHGLVIAFWFEDVEGRNPRDEAERRVQFQQMLRMIDGGQVRCVVVDTIERLGFKDQHEFGHFIHSFRTKGCVAWSTVDGNLSSVDPGKIFQHTAKTVSSKIEVSGTAYRNLSAKIGYAKNGEYQGGYPPFGFDVVCFDGDKEVWRVVYDGGHHRRVKVHPDGTRQRYDGKGNFPARDKDHKLRVRPSIEFADRLEIVQRMFGWVANESLSPSQIATRLNQLGIVPQVGEAWNKVVVKSNLRNPVFTGFPTYNKRAQGKYAECINGTTKHVELVPGEVRPKKGRIRRTEDMIQPETAQFISIVDIETFLVVQEKLDEASRKQGKKRSPKVASFWLKDLIFCGKCRKGMRNTSQNGRAYYCSTYGTYGKVNPTGCKCHKVKADLIESVVLQYCEDIGGKLAAVHSVQTDLGIPSTIMEPLKAAEKRNTTAWNKMKNFLATFLEDGVQEIVVLGNRIKIEKFGDDIRLPDGFSPFDLFGHFYSAERQKLVLQIAELEAEFDELYSQFKALKSERAKNRANEEMVRVEDEIKNRQSKLEPIDDEIRASYRETSRLLDSLHSFRSATNEGNDRRKAEFAKSLVREVVCHFRYTDTKAANKPKSVLERVEIFPQVGDPTTCFPKGNMQEQD